MKTFQIGNKYDITSLKKIDIDKLFEFDHLPETFKHMENQQNDQPIPRYSDYFPLQGMLGNLEALELYAGQSVGSINEEQDAHMIMGSLVSETLNAYEALTKKFITHDDREDPI